MKNVPALAFEAAQLIDRLERLSRNTDAKTGLNPAQWEALRYIARANRFSRTPMALADYLGSTRGTVSQTLITLEDKGYVMRQPSHRDRRSLDLALTLDGQSALRSDPLIELARDLASGADRKLSVLVDILRATLRAMIHRNGGKAFGACHSCRHFERNVSTSSSSPHRCGLLNEPLSERDSQAICFEQVDREALV